MLNAITTFPSHHQETTADNIPLIDASDRSSTSGGFNWNSLPPLTPPQHASSQHSGDSQQALKRQQCLRINVSGASFSILRASLLRYPHTRLGKLANAESAREASGLCDALLSATQEFYYDRSPFAFDAIANFYRYHVIHMPETMCTRSFLDEMDYWGLDKAFISKCCQLRLSYMELQEVQGGAGGSLSANSRLGDASEIITNECAGSHRTDDDCEEISFIVPSLQGSKVTGSPQNSLNSNRKISADGQSIVTNGSNNNNNNKDKAADAQSPTETKSSCTRCNCKLLRWLCDNDARNYAWKILEDPCSSRTAMAFTVVSVAFVITTVTLLVIGSLPQYRPDGNNTNATPFMHNVSHANASNTNGISSSERVFFLQGIEIGDAVCVGWFTLEFIARLWAAPKRTSYLSSSMCWIDLASIIPFFVELILSFTGVNSKTFDDVRKSLLMIRLLRALRVMRVIRVLKVARYSRGFQSVGATLQKSWREMLMLALFMFTTNIIFSTIMYFLEGNEYPDSKFSSIPAASWWCIITMTTVGYGDVYPFTVAGKILAGITSIIGIILLAFPISVIVEHFHEEYTAEHGEPEDNASAASGAILSQLTQNALKRQSYVAALITQDTALNDLVRGSVQIELRPFESIPQSLNSRKSTRRRIRRGFKV